MQNPIIYIRKFGKSTTDASCQKLNSTELKYWNHVVGIGKGVTINCILIQGQWVRRTGGLLCCGPCVCFVFLLFFCLFYFCK